MIPKIIHFCWLSDDPVPADLQKNMDSWKEKLPGYEFRKWDFSVFDKNSSIWVKEAFENKKYAFACDFIRIFAVYHYGGIYLDMDVEVVRSFDPLITQSRMFGSESQNDKMDIEAGCFGAEKGDVFLGKCLEYYKNRHFIKEDGSFDMITLPNIMRKVIIENNFKIDTYGCDHFTCKSFQTGKISMTENTYAIHHFAGSWLSEEQRKINEDTRKMSRYVGPLIARNIAEYGSAIRSGNVFELTRVKIARKMNRFQKR